LAVAIAHEIGTEFRDGVAFLDLASVKDPHEVTTAAAAVVGLAEPVEDLNSRLLETIRERELLLVLDTCEHVVEAVAWLTEEIYRYAPSVAILATSRESLQVAGEFVYQIGPLEVPPEGLKGAAELVTYSSAQLLMACAIAAGCSASLTDAEAETVGNICRTLDGVPLAIELVASRVSAHGMTDLDELIDDRLRLAWRRRRTAALRHQSLSAALDWSYELISPTEQTLLQCLSVFPSAFTREGARAVAGDLIGSDAVVETLEQLVAKSLVVSCPSPGQARFRLLNTTRAYASEKLAAAGAARATNQRHTRYVLQALTPRKYESAGKRAGGWAHTAELLPDVRAALTWAYSDVGDPGIQIPLAAACGRLFVELNLLDEWRLWADRALCTPDDADQAA
jgi:predicted ATPase